MNRQCPNPRRCSLKGANHVHIPIVENAPVGLSFNHQSDSTRSLWAGSNPHSLDYQDLFASALATGIDRFIFNPASTVENLFYFGFLAERLRVKLGRFWTPVLIGTMYGFHEMTNTEYWYEGRFFPLIFIGVAVFTAIYLWRRNVIAIWVGDGLGKFISRLF